MDKQDFGDAISAAKHIINGPAQMVMAAVGGEDDIFQGHQQVGVNQLGVEMMGCCESADKYFVVVPDEAYAKQVGGETIGNRSGVEGALNFMANGAFKGGRPILYIDDAPGSLPEVLAGLPRKCCGQNRAIKWQVHNGQRPNDPVIQTMEKDFHCQQLPCCCRASFRVSGKEGPIGFIGDPCRCCWTDQQVFKNESDYQNGNPPLFTVSGHPCQCGIWCGCCYPAQFNVYRHGSDKAVAGVHKDALSISECCFQGVNRFTINFDQIRDPLEKRLLFASMMLLDFEYFETTPSDSSGGGA